MSYVEKEKLIKADLASIENRVRHAFNQGYDLGYKEGKTNKSENPTSSTTKNDLSSELEKNSKKLEKNFGELDCISRQQAIDAFPDLLPNIGYNKKVITEILQKLPSITPIRPKGHWIDNTDLGYHVSICSNCSWRGHGDTNLIYKPKYCPNCGAEMESEE